VDEGSRMSQNVNRVESGAAVIGQPGQRAERGKMVSHGFLLIEHDAIDLDNRKQASRR
jgi:hypothetical protein